MPLAPYYPTKSFSLYLGTFVGCGIVAGAVLTVVSGCGSVLAALVVVPVSVATLALLALARRGWGDA